MKRQPLTDDSGAWFDLDKATPYDEDTYWDGNNTISVATGSQWDHEMMWRTAGGRWILHRDSSWRGSGESWEAVEPDVAARWMVRNGHEPPELTAQVAKLEIT